MLDLHQFESVLKDENKHLIMPEGRQLTYTEWEYLGITNGQTSTTKLTFAEYCELPHDKSIPARLVDNRTFAGGRGAQEYEPSVEWYFACAGF